MNVHCLTDDDNVTRSYLSCLISHNRTMKELGRKFDKFMLTTIISIILISLGLLMCGCEASPPPEYPTEISMESFDEIYAGGMSLWESLETFSCVTGSPVCNCVEEWLQRPYEELRNMIECEDGQPYPITDEVIPQCEDAAYYIPIIMCHYEARRIMISNSDLTYDEIISQF